MRRGPVQRYREWRCRRTGHIWKYRGGRSVYGIPPRTRVVPFHSWYCRRCKTSHEGPNWPVV